MVLDVLKSGNNKKPYRERVLYKEFHNDAVNKDLDLNKDFNIWIKEREKCRKENVPFDKFRVFTICSFPWILDSAFKAEILKHANKINQEREAVNSMSPMNLLNLSRVGMHLMFEVNRSNILDDALRVISKPDQNFKKPLRVIFQGEPGIDEGGVRKEFFQLLIKDLFNPEYGMFNFNEKKVMYYINGLSHESNINFELIGVLMGLAIYNNIILGVSFPQAIYKILLFEEPDFEDL